MIILPTEETHSSPRSSSSLEIVLYSDEEGEITIDGEEEDDEALPNHNILPNGVLYEQENDDGLFEMEDIPSSSNNSLQYNDDASSQVDMHVRYYAPTNEEPHGLSQSVIINDHDFLRRSIMNMRSSNYNMNNHSSYRQQLVSVLEEVEEDYEYEHNDYRNTGEDDHSLYTVPFPDTVNEIIYSQSAPNFSSFENYAAKEEDEKIDDDNSTVGPGSVHSGSSTGTIIRAIVLPQEERQRDEDTSTVHQQQNDVTSQQHDNHIASPQEQTDETDDANLPHQIQEININSPPPREEESNNSNTPVSQDNEFATYNCPSLPSLQDGASTKRPPSSPYSQDRASTERPPSPPQDEPSTANPKVQDEVTTANPLPQDETTLADFSSLLDEPSTADPQVQYEVAIANPLPQDETIATASSSQEPDITEPSLKDEKIVNYILSPDITTDDPLQQPLSGTQQQGSLSSPQRSFPYQQDATTATFQQCIDNMLESYQKREDEYTSWSKLASSHYRENSRIDHNNSNFYQQRVDHRNSTWERMHSGPDAYRQITRNTFIFECIARYAFSIKVTGLSRFARFKDIQMHFFDPNVVFIRYIRLIHCAYVMYRNYEEMVKAVARFKDSVICGKPIHCRPSYYGELDKDNQLHSEIISRPARPNSTTRRYNNNNQRRIASRGRRDTFIPEYHGVKQIVPVNGRPRQTPPINYYPSPVALCIKTTTTNTINMSNATKKMSNASKMLSNYHPTQTVTTLTSYCKDVAIKDHHRHYFTNIIPSAISCFAFMAQYVVLKPWSIQDVRFSQINNYWSFCPRNAAVLNFLFNHTPQANLIFHLRGSQAFQGYAVMKSEVMDLKALSNQEIFGTPFQRFGRCYKATLKGRVWRYVCRVEWKSRGKTSSKGTDEYTNPWNRNIQVKLSKDCTILEPNLGKKIVEKISSRN